MRKLSKEKQRNRVMAGIMTIILILSNIPLNSFVTVKAATEYITLYFVDNTTEQWVGNDNAEIEAVDNTNGHDSYWMTKVNETLWSVTVPDTAYNITFNRYNSDKTTQWNSWSAGGRDENNAYYAQGTEYGYWGSFEETEMNFQAGDIIYLDISEFTSWKDADAIMYINFSNASKEDNNGQDIVIADANQNIFFPIPVATEVEEDVYQYIVTEEMAGKGELRFWRGNETTLWNCSNTLSYEEYVQGNNCIKVTGWNDIGETYFYDWKNEREKEPLEDIGEAYYKAAATEDVVTDEETGIIYVKNQVLVSALQGAPREVFEEIAVEVGAEIVGYIELTNDYQFEFNTDKTMEELNTMIDYLNSFSFVSYASLNIVEIREQEITTTNDTWYNDGATTYTIDEVTNKNSSQPDEWNEEVPDGDNWGLEALRVPSAWDYSTSFQTVRVGVYDQSFTYHEDIIFDDIVNNAPKEKDRHGNHVTGILAATHNNKKGISGVATDTRLYAYGTSGETGIASSMATKHAYATLIGNRIKVINVSLGADVPIAFAASHGVVKAQNCINAGADVLGEFLNKLILQGYEFVIVTSAGNSEDDRYVYDSTTTYNYRLYDRSKDIIEDIVSGGVDAYYDCALTAIELSSVKNRIIVVGAVNHTVSNGTTIYNYTSFSNIGSRVDVCAPGEKILSTVPPSADSTGYLVTRGTSMASPYIAGVAALMYQVNPSIKATQVKNIICTSCYTSVTDAHGNNYGMPDTKVCVEKASDTYSLSFSKNNLPSGILTGNVSHVLGLPVSGAKITASRTSIGESNLDDYHYVTQTDNKGNYEIVLSQGNYNIYIYADGYIPYIIKNVQINPDETTYLENILLSEWSRYSPFSNISGTVINALDGSQISGATVKLRTGWNNRTGKYISTLTGVTKTATTDENGNFSFTLSGGAYTAEIVKDDYVTGYCNIIADLSEITQTIVLTPVLAENEYRIVLTWGSTPWDLDSHLTYYVDSVKEKHIYYANKTETCDGETIATLDLDDTSGYGPETVTLTLNADFLANGIFKYSVHDYSNKLVNFSTSLSMSDAVVRVYKGNSLILNLNVPKNKEGTVWHVFDLSKDGIKLYNEFYSESTPNNIQ